MMNYLGVHLFPSSNYACCINPPQEFASAGAAAKDAEKFDASLQFSSKTGASSPAVRTDQFKLCAVLKHIAPTTHCMHAHQ